MVEVIFKVFSLLFSDECFSFLLNFQIVLITNSGGHFFLLLSFLVQGGNIVRFILMVLKSRKDLKLLRFLFSRCIILLKRYLKGI